MLKNVKFRVVGGAVLIAVLAFGMVAEGGSLSPPPGAISATDRTQISDQLSTAPHTITSSGSYVLTSNFGDINITASDVTLDLNGFTVDGTITITADRVTLRNGTVLNGGISAGAASDCRYENLLEVAGGGSGRDRGLALGPGSIVITVIAIANVGPGILVGPGSNVTNSVAISNAGPGIVAGDGSAIVDCKAYDNAGNGIEVGSGSTISACASRFNTGSGIALGDDCTVSDSTATENDLDGIVGLTGCTISTSTAGHNDGAGISLNDGSAVAGCTASWNGGTGIATEWSSTITGCVATDNALDGIRTFIGGEVSHCTANQNLGDQIDVNEASTVSYCAVASITSPGIRAWDNSLITDCTVAAAKDGGIIAGDDSTVRNCRVNMVLDEGFGIGAIDVGSRSSVIENDVSGTGLGFDADCIVVGGDGNRVEGNRVTGRHAEVNGYLVLGVNNLIVKNSAAGVFALAYNIAPGNHDAAIVVAPGGGFILAAPVGGPWSNFEY